SVCADDVCRPVAVIDPENREQVERLTSAFYSQYPLVTFHASAESLHVDRLQAALREFANPTPPRIDEPGTWGVVEASCVHADARREWMHHPDGNWYVVGTDTKNNPDDWDSLVGPVLIREGI